MSAITKSARGEDCMIRTPVCSFDNDTTVLCHLPAMKMGGKGPDFQGAYGCSACHDLVDGRTKTELYDFATIRVWFYQGVIRTQNILVEKGLLNF
jgi:hypothetical protein